MKHAFDKLRELFFLKVRFAMTGLVATGVDYTVYLLLVGRYFIPEVANVISYSCGMVINFILQKRFVFVLQGSVSRAFVLSVLVSLGGMAISTGIIHLLIRWAFFMEHQYITKLLATGIVFFYNFYFKRYVFERRFL